MPGACPAIFEWNNKPQQTAAPQFLHVVSWKAPLAVNIVSAGSQKLLCQFLIFYREVLSWFRHGISS